MYTCMEGTLYVCIMCMCDGRAAANGAQRAAGSVMLPQVSQSGASAKWPSQSLFASDEIKVNVSASDLGEREKEKILREPSTCKNHASFYIYTWRTYIYFSPLSVLLSFFLQMYSTHTQHKAHNAIYGGRRRGRESPWRTRFVVNHT